jgi:hypothetical protein
MTNFLSKQNVIYLETCKGATIFPCAEEAIEIAKEFSIPVIFIFNDISLIVNSDSDEKKVVESYMKKRGDL